jgi:TolA-binding protein
MRRTNPVRLCKCCALYYDLDEFSRTKTERVRYICKSCEIMRKEQAKIEWLRYQTEKRNEMRLKKLEKGKTVVKNRIKEVKDLQHNQTQRLKFHIISNNPDVDITKITSFTVNFDD